MKAAATSTPAWAGIEGGVSAIRIASSSSAECSSCRTRSRTAAKAPTTASSTTMRIVRAPAKCATGWIAVPIR